MVRRPSETDRGYGFRARDGVAPRNDDGSAIVVPAMTNSNERAHPDRLLLVFCTRLPCAACSRMLCFSSSRWPLVVSRGTAGVLPGPLWLCSSAGTGLMALASGFVIGFSVAHP